MPGIVLDDIIGATGLPVVTMLDPTQRTEHEKTATGHCIFDKGGAANLVNRVPGGPALNPLGVGSHTHNANSMTVSGAANTGLDLGLVDKHGFAWCAVVKMLATPGATILSSYDAVGGIKTQLALSASNDIRTSWRGASPVLLAYDPVITPAVGTWLFIAVASQLSGTDNLLETVIHNFGAPQQSTAIAGTRTLNSNKFALGSPYEGVATNPFEIAELIWWNTQKPLSFLTGEVYPRTKARMKQPGRNIALA